MTAENIGKIHNELLKSFSVKSLTRSGSVIVPEDMAACFDVFKTELLESGEYDITEEETRILQSEISDFHELLSLPIDAQFYNNSLIIVRDKIEYNDGIGDDVKNVLYEIMDENCTLSSDELHLLAEKYKEAKGGEYLIVYSNIFKASSEYWQPVATRNSNNRKVIAADCAGGLAGLACGGVMSVIWAAAFSYSLDKCLDNIAVTSQPEKEKIYATSPENAQN